MNESMVLVSTPVVAVSISRPRGKYVVAIQRHDGSVPAVTRNFKVSEQQDAWAYARLTAQVAESAAIEDAALATAVARCTRCGDTGRTQFTHRDGGVCYRCPAGDRIRGFNPRAKAK